MNFSKRHGLFGQILFVMLLAAVLFGAFGQVLYFGSLQLDDPKHVFENPLILQGSLGNLLRVWREPRFSLFVPVTYTLWYWGARISEMCGLPLTAGMHGLNLLLHFFCSCLVFSCLKAILDCLGKPRSTLRAGLGALIFALHPLQVSTISWVSLADNSLAAALGLMAWRGYLSLYSLRRGEDVVPKRTFAIFSTCFVAALLAKSTLVILPVWVVAIDRIVLKRKWKECVTPLLMVWVTLSIPIAVVAKFLQPTGEIPHVAPTWFRPIVALDALSFYVRKVIFPFGLAIDYGRTPLWLREHYASEGWWAAILVGICLVTWRRKVGRSLRAILILFAVGILPVAGFIPFSYQTYSTVAGHYVYWSLIAVAAGLVLQEWILLPKGFIALSLLVIAYFGMSTYECSCWKNDATAFGRSLRANPNSFLVHNDLGVYYFAEKDYYRAAYHFQEAIRCAPERTPLYSNLKNSLALMESHDQRP